MRLCTGKIGEPTTVEKMDRSSCVGVERDRWTMAVSGVSITNGQERLAWADLHEITRGGLSEEEAFINNRVIETGRGRRNRSF